MMLADAYARSLHRTIHAGMDASKACTSLFTMLKCEGKQALLPTIMRAYTRIVQAQTQRAPTLTVASATDESVAKKALGTRATDARTIVDETIIGGFVFAHNATRIDTSFKTALLTMYRTITKN